MYDIEIIDGYRVALITAESPATKFIKAFYGALVMKRLSSDTPETANLLNESELAVATRSAINVNLQKDLAHMFRAGLIGTRVERVAGIFGQWYCATDEGLDVYRRIRNGEEEIEIELE